MNEVKEHVPEQKNLLNNLWNGNLGLAMTYWVYGVLGGVVWAVGILALRPEPGSDFAKIIYFMMVAYYVVVYIGIWKAANKFTGNNLWAILAKLVVVIVVLPFVIGLSHQQYKNGQDEQERQDRLEQASRHEAT